MPEIKAKIKKNIIIGEAPQYWEKVFRNNIDAF